MSALAGFVFLVAVATVFAALALVCLAPWGSTATITRLTGRHERLAALTRFLTRHGEGNLARTQRRMFATVISALPRTRAGVVHVPGKITVTVGAVHAAALAGYEHVAEAELGAELRGYASKFKMVSPARVVVRVVASAALDDDAIEVDLSDATVVDSPPTDVMPAGLIAPAGVALVTDDGRTGLIAAEPVTVGRASANGIVVADPKVSARHCRFSRVGDDFVVTDLGSTNGTKVNGHTVSNATIRVGDRISVGSTTFMVQRP